MSADRRREPRLHERGRLVDAIPGLPSEGDHDLAWNRLVGHDEPVSDRPKEGNAQQDERHDHDDEDPQVPPAGATGRGNVGEWWHGRGFGR